MWIAKFKNKIVQNILHWLPAILLTFLIPGVVSFIFNLSLENILLHDWSKAYIYPITIFCIMSSMSLAQLKIVGLKPLLLFFIGSFTIAVIPALLFMFYYLGSEEMVDLWRGIIPIVGSWIGGSSSMLVLKEYVAVREDLFLSVLLLDNMIQNIVGSYSGHIQIHSNGYWEEQTIDNAFEYNDSLIEKIEINQEVDHTTKRLQSGCLSSYKDLSKFVAMFCMGGPMDTWMEKDYPWLIEEKKKIKEFVVDLNKPYLGFCLGCQLLGEVIGGKVVKTNNPEIGMLDLSLIHI